MSVPTIVLAAPASGSGKTLVTLAILRAMHRRGRRVGAFKTGPDYIDAAYLAAAAGSPCRNLDSWAMRLETLLDAMNATGEARDIVIGEGVMGLFDGAPDGRGSTADLASMFDVPVVLTVDASRQGASVAAIVSGFVRHREDVEVRGVILNRVGGPDHEALLRAAIDEHLSLPVLGALPRVEELGLPSRHLGLVQAQEQGGLQALIERAADLVEARLDLDLLHRLARPPGLTALAQAAAPLPALGRRIAVARDPAFSFCYDLTLDGWRRQGAELAMFSPVADEPPPAGCDAVYLPGGYPELFVDELSREGDFKRGLRALAAQGAVIYGECGGYMVLGTALLDENGTPRPMAGLLPVTTSIQEPQRHLGYRQLRLVAGGELGAAGTALRGHEYHYAREIERTGEPLFEVADARDRPLGHAGIVKGRVMGSFHHLIDRRDAPRPR